MSKAMGTAQNERRGVGIRGQKTRWSEKQTAATNEYHSHFKKMETENCKRSPGCKQQR